MRLCLLAALLLCLIAAPALADEYDLGTMALTVEQGVVTAMTVDGTRLSLGQLIADVGCDGAFVQNSLGYQRFDAMNTWDLAPIVPKAGEPYAAERYDISHEGDTLVITQEIEGLVVRLEYTALRSALRLTAFIESRRAYVSELRGAHIALRGMPVPESAVYRFPGNTPTGWFTLSDQRAFAVRQTDYCNPITMVRFSDASGLNVLFLDTEEKWSTGVYRLRDGSLCVSHLAMAEGLIAPGETITVGSLYLQATREDAYAPVRALYDELGYRAPDTGYESGLLYSCHPAGTMDSGFRDTKTMSAYAQSLPALKAMGVESVWILPIFEHTGRGVYEPTDQRLIDPRYGTDADVRAYTDAAHALGIRVLFDYVPHGPFPQDELAVDNVRWCSVARDGSLQIEWDCVSFDMANPEYQAYTRDLIAEHAARFSVDGGRIDCAMGGLSNWKPQAGSRASSSGLKGGQGIVTAIREGFEQSGKTPLLLPENFHPVPFYAGITDIFYDMPLYRAMYELRQSGADEPTFAAALADFLHSEHLSSVPGQLKLRFLGNHDTVSLTWDGMRATAVYGEEKAKALWTLMAFIDGVPFLYMGDENSDLYHFKAGFDLTAFFTELYAARARYLNDDMDTRYLDTQGAAIVFERRGEGETLLCLINLGRTQQLCALPQGAYEPVYGAAELSAHQAILPPYGCLMLRALPN